MRKLIVPAGLLYLALLASSTVARLRAPAPPDPPGRQITTLEAVHADLTRGDAVEVAWVDHEAQPVNHEALPIVLLHGSPGSAGDFRRLGPLLAESRRAIAIDLPGFGASARSVPDYSILAHAVYVRDLLDHLGIERFHVLGFSMGGGVALHLAEMLGPRVASVTLVSAIGVQELELLGSYTINHFIHGVQLFGIRGLQLFFPHFGALDRFPLDVPYCRNFYDTDQRPLRRVLATMEQPLLIVHGEHDPLVPAQAAREHERLAPHSRLVMLDASHFFVFGADPRLVAPLTDFLDRADSGDAPGRADAAPERLARAALPFDRGLIPGFTGPALLVVLLVLALATLVSEDLTCIAAGLLVAQGRVAFAPAATACYVGIVVGDMLLFWAGRALGRPALRRAPLRWWVSGRALDESSAWLRRRGGIVVLLSRFLPGARLPTNLAAGILDTSSARFFVYFSVAGLLWTPPFVWLSARAGDSLLPRLGGLRSGALVIVVALVAFMWLIRHLFVPLLTWRGRRRLAGRWGRLTRWEFWPWWAIYPPVIASILRLGLRYRSATLFTAVNPAIPGGGIVGESKAQILRALGSHPAIPRWRFLPEAPLEERLSEIHRFLEEQGGRAAGGAQARHG